MSSPIFQLPNDVNKWNSYHACIKSWFFSSSFSSLLLHFLKTKANAKYCAFEYHSNGTNNDWKIPWKVVDKRKKSAHLSRTDFNWDYDLEYFTPRPGIILRLWLGIYYGNLLGFFNRALTHWHIYSLGSNFQEFFNLEVSSRICLFNLFSISLKLFG